MGHLPSPLAECAVGGLWSAVRASGAVLEEDLCVSRGWRSEAVVGSPAPLCSQPELVTNTASLTGSGAALCGD